MSPPTIDSSNFPYVDIVYQPSMSELDLERYGVDLDAVFARGLKTPCVVVVDTRPASVQRATLSARRSLVGIVNEVHKRYPGAVLAEAVVLQGELAASLYMAYLWLLRDKRILRRSFRNKEDATRWAKSLLVETPSVEAPPVDARVGQA